MSRSRFISGFEADAEPEVDAWVFAFAERRLLVHHEGDVPRLPSHGEIAELLPERRLHLGRLDERQVLACELAGEPDIPIGAKLRDLRGLGLQGAFDDVVFQVAGRAVQLVDWDRNHRFCGRCGGPTKDQPGEPTKRCSHCDLQHYPRLSPAVIVAVERPGEILLARSPHFPPGMWSTLAGFVEPGESLEETVRREIEEEVGVQVDEVRYFGSQPWPFPNSLMIGFLARYAGGEIRCDDEEIEAADWFSPDDLPQIPPKLSIARALIDDFLSRSRQGEKLP